MRLKTHFCGSICLPSFITTVKFHVRKMLAVTKGRLEEKCMAHE
jgi:hypothetical protein